MLNNLKNIFRFGWESFSRSKMLSFQVIFIMAVVVLATSALYVFRGLSSHLISQVQKKVDVVVAFNREASEENILKVREELYGFSSGIENIDYVSKEQALEDFQLKHGEDPLYQKALQELQDNPLRASLNIKASSLSCYADVAVFLQAERFNNLVYKVSYNDPLHKRAIERLISISSGVKNSGLIASIILAVLMVLITFNTVKLSIFSLKSEIATMRLVGASNMLIRGPFIVHVLLCGLFAIVITNILFFLTLLYLNEKTGVWLMHFNVINYFQDSLLVLLGLQLGIILVFGIFSTALAVRKYLKV